MAAVVVVRLGVGLCQTRRGLEARVEAVVVRRIPAMATMALQTLEAVVVGRETVTTAARVVRAS